jgi:hypothetical protein
MKKCVSIVFLVLVLAGCQQPDSKRELKSDDRIEVPEILKNEAGEIEEQYENREISLGQYKLQMAELLDEAERLQLRMDNLSEAEYLPEWALEVGLSIPKGLKIVPEFSHMTSQDDRSEMFNSITLVYEGDYETAMAEAKRIAESAGIPQSTSWQKNMEMSKKLGNPVSKGITYMNYDFGMNEEVEYLMVVEVDPSGKLTISAADARQMKSIINRHALDPEK